MTRFHCTTAADLRAEPLFATASRVDRWVCIEQPGPWGPESVPDARLDPDVFFAVRRHAAAARARLLIVRRPAGKGLSRRRHVLVPDSRPGHDRALVTTVDDVAELADLRLPFADADVDARWQPAPDPLLLVCTHGRHDPCCAMRGRPVA